MATLTNNNIVHIVRIVHDITEFVRNLTIQSVLVHNGCINNVLINDGHMKDLQITDSSGYFIIHLHSCSSVAKGQRNS